jgi:hypothetical protein
LIAVHFVAASRQTCAKKTVQLGLGRIAKAKKSFTNKAARMSGGTGACVNSSG